MVMPRTKSAAAAERYHLCLPPIGAMFLFRASRSAFAIVSAITSVEWYSSSGTRASASAP